MTQLLGSLMLLGIAAALFACGPSASPAASTATPSSPAAPTPALATTPTAATQAGPQFQIALTGAAERPNPGDPDGSGTAKVTLNADKNEVCYEISVSNITLPATGAHIHSGAADASGPIVVPFTAPNANGSSNGCAANLDADLINKIRQDPAGYYVNIHSTDFPAGAVRGQLSGSASADPYIY